MMDKTRTYHWDLSSDELDTVRRALTDRQDRYLKEAKETGNPDTHFLKMKLANKCTALLEQISRMYIRW